MLSAIPAGTPALGHVALDFPATDVLTLIGSLGQALAPCLGGVSPDALVAAALRREAEASTALKCQVALPHARLPELARTCVAFARLRHAVDWAGQPVLWVYLLAVPQNQVAAYLALNQRLMRLLRDGARLRELDDFSNEDECRRWHERHLQLPSLP